MPNTSSLAPFLDDHHLELATELERFCDSELRDRPAPDGDDAARHEARKLLDLLGEAGWLSHAVPAGPSLDRRACCLIREALAAASPLADAVFALQCLAMQPVLLAGQAQAHQSWVDRARCGEAMTAFAMTEESAGSDVSGVATTGTADGAGWTLDGGKRFISNAGIADVYVVLAVTDASASPPRLAWFLVPSGTEGLEFSRAQVMSEPHPLGEIEFEGCRVPQEALVGSEGDGFRLAMATLNRLRPTVAAAACGMATRALDEALEHSQSRQQFGRPIAKFQLIQQKLAVMATELEAARLLTYKAAWRGDRSEDELPADSAMAKWYATEVAQRVVDQAVQIHGGAGVLESSPVDRLYRAVRALRIYEGATEIQQLVVARELLKARDPGAS